MLIIESDKVIKYFFLNISCLSSEHGDTWEVRHALELCANILYAFILQKCRGICKDGVGGGDII